MHALEFPSLSTTQRPGKCVSAVAPEEHSSCHVLPSRGLFARLAMFVVLARCSRAADAITYTVHRVADKAAADTGSLRCAVNMAVSGARAAHTSVPAGPTIVRATSRDNGTLSRSLAKKISPARQLSRRSNLGASCLAEALPLIPLGGLPVLSAAVLWPPETEDLSDFRIAGVQDEPVSIHPRSHRWIRIGMLVLFAMALMGMLFGCGG